MFNGQKGVNNIFVFGIVSDSLTVGNYNYDSTYFAASLTANAVTYNGVQSHLFYAGDYMNIHVTSYWVGLSVEILQLNFRHFQV